MKYLGKNHTPVGKIVCVEETTGQKLQRLARVSLPVYPVPKDRSSKNKQKCICGEYLSAHPKKRQREKVCDDCANVIPRIYGSRPILYKCDGCLSPVPRRNLKMKNGKLYCKKCLKIKFHIDF